MDVNTESRPMFRANEVDSTAPVPDTPHNGASQPASGDAQATEPQSERRISRVHSIIAGNGDAPGAEPSDGRSKIPTYNLAENILAEHRRMAATRRKAPTRASAGPKAPPADRNPKPPAPAPLAGPKVHVALPPSPSQPPEVSVETRRGDPLGQGRPVKAGPGGSGVGWPLRDLPELQRVVAEIVARDVDRLCRQLSRPSCT